jgi:hypothetical protein
MREVAAWFLPFIAAVILPPVSLLGLARVTGEFGIAASPVVAAVAVFGIARAFRAPVLVQVYAPLLSLSISAFVTYTALQGIR